jgi:hypothetical protein
MALVQGVLVQNDWLSSDIYYGKRRATLLTFREELAAEPAMTPNRVLFGLRKSYS